MKFSHAPNSLCLALSAAVTLLFIANAGCDRSAASQRGGEAAEDGNEIEAKGEREKENGENVEPGASDEDRNVPSADPDTPADEEAPPSPAVEQAENAEAESQHPFARRIQVPDFPAGMEWINSGPLSKKDLEGKFVLLDFWTYCCINCMHVLPELKKLEQAYPKNLVVIGVHSAKFDTEKETDNIREAVLRYEIEHPVVNDSGHRIWNTYGVQSWPTILLIDPQGNAVWGRSGETKFEEVDEILQDALPYYRKRGLLDERPVRFDLAARQAEKTPLRFPGKVLADERSDRLFISDSNHNRIVIATLDGLLVDTVGSGAIGADDGDFDSATFDHPQGMALRGEALYVADTENHLIRRIDLKAKSVETIAGTGEQGQGGWPGLDELGPGAPLPERWIGKPLETAISSPWAVWPQGGDLFIAMAGPHQIWRLSLDGAEIGPYAGNGREDIVDGPLLPRQPYEPGYSSFAQPSGLTSDGTWLYVADSEGSSIRAVPFPGADAGGEGEVPLVKTVVGTAELPFGRLFEFGLIDGPREKARLQHALGVVWHDGAIYVADTYNNAVRSVNAETGEVQTLAGKREARKETDDHAGLEVEVEKAVGVPGFSDEEGTFDEPAGISFAAGRLYIADTNNHAVRIVDLKTHKVATLKIDGLEPPRPPAAETMPSFPDAEQIAPPAARVKALAGKIGVSLRLDLPLGWKINPLAPMTYLVEAEGDSGPIERGSLGGLKRVEEPAPEFEFTVPVEGEGKDTLRVSLNYYYCQESGDGLCKMGSVMWTVPVEISAAADGDSIKLQHQVQK